MLDDIRKIAANYTTEEVNLNTDIKNDLCLTSFDIVTMVGELEEFYEVHISEEDMMEIVTIEDLIKCIESKKQG